MEGAQEHCFQRGLGGWQPSRWVDLCEEGIVSSMDWVDGSSYDGWIAAHSYACMNNRSCKSLTAARQRVDGGACSGHTAA